LTTTALGVARREDLLLEVFTNALAVFVANDEVSEAELDYLHRLRSALSLGDAEVETAHKRVALPRLAQAIEAAYADAHITDEEAARLDRLRDRLMLDSPDAKALYEKYATDAAQRVVRRVTEDGLLSPWEQKMLDNLGARLGLARLEFDGPAKHMLERCALMWRVQNGELPETYSPHNLQRGEVCHLVVSGVAWHEIRTQTQRIDYVGAQASIRIARGVRFRVGSVTPHRVTREVLTPIDTGSLSVTNKRLIFDGAHKNSALRHSSLLGVRVFSDGIEVEKASGRSPFFLFNDDTEIIAAIISAAMANA
jgi:hypothetical protein